MLLAAPGHRVRDGPPAHALAVELEIRAEPVETAAKPRQGPRTGEHVLLPVADHRHGRELALGRDRLRVDREPRLARAAQDVPGVQVLVREHERPLRRAELAQRVRRLRRGSSGRTGGRCAATASAAPRPSELRRPPAGGARRAAPSRASAGGRPRRRRRRRRRGRSAASRARSARGASRDARGLRPAAVRRRRRPRREARGPRARDSSCGQPIFSTASPAGATNEQYPPSMGGPRSSCQRSAHSSTSRGSRSSHSDPPGKAPQVVEAYRSASIFCAIVRASARTSSTTTFPFAPAA